MGNYDYKLNNFTVKATISFRFIKEDGLVESSNVDEHIVRRLHYLGFEVMGTNGFPTEPITLIAPDHLSMLCEPYKVNIKTI